LEQFVVVHDFRNIAPAEAANRTDKNDGQTDKRVRTTELPAGQPVLDIHRCLQKRILA
jgi:hypothetical protein